MAAIELGGEGAAVPSELGGSYQWHLRNTGLAVGSVSGVAGIDANVVGAWADYTGRGVRIGIYDDGFDLLHPELAGRFQGGWDSRNSDPSPQAEGKDRHGTSVAGIIGADDNATGVVGVAFGADLYGYRSGFGSEGSTTISVDALSRQDEVDVSNNSWGFSTPFQDDFRLSGFQGHRAALEAAATQGRDGLGTVWVFSAGNDRTSGDNVNYHNLRNSQYSVAVASVDAGGKFAASSSPGAALLVAAPGVSLLTTDRLGTDGYSTGDTTNFGGTSAAAPVVSGVVALMLEANPYLGYRDVQQILAYSARPIDTGNASWTTNGASDWNGAGHRFSNDYGFGLVDATAATRLAETWFVAGTTAATAANRVVASGTWAESPLAVPDNTPAGASALLALNASVFIERIELDLDIRHTWRGDLSVTLVAPSGTQSLLVSRPGGTSGDTGNNRENNNILFTVTSNAFRGEDALGTWRLLVADNAAHDLGTLNGWTLRAIGSAASDNDTYVYTNFLSDLPGGSRRVLSDSAGIDTINAAAVTAGSTLDLDGGFCIIDGVIVTIAFGTVIENAFGGDGNDTIIGNLAANILLGGRGNDRLDGRGGVDSAVFDTTWDSVSLAWENDLLVVTDLAGRLGIDRLSDIETLVFNDRTVDVASLVTSAAAEIVFTNTTPADTGPGRAFAATTPGLGEAAMLGAADLGIVGVDAATLVTLDRALSGALSVTLESAWNTLKVAKVTDSDGGELAIANFVEVAVNMGGSAASQVTVTDAKRGNIATGAGDDTITVQAISNRNDKTNTMVVSSGEGNDTILLTAHRTGWSVFDVQAGADDDTITILGTSADRVDAGSGNDRIDAGGGKDRITAGDGRDIVVVRAGSGADVWTDFQDGLDLILIEGDVAAVMSTAVAGGVELFWFTGDSLVLRGVSVDQISIDDFLFA
jgi:subtilisin-like proprotein convertase family protein